MIVLDASAAVEFVANRVLGQRVGERISSAGTLHAPHLLVLEVAQALRRLAAVGEMAPDRGPTALGDLRDLGVVHHDHHLLVDRVWALRHNLTAYDAAYVALAELLESPLVTCDGRLAEAPGHEAAIELIRS